MDWRDEGLLLSVRRHGESNAIAEVLTAEHGRHSGLVRGGRGPQLAPILQPGAQLALEWRARLSEHLGIFKVEPIKSRVGAILADKVLLAALNSVSVLTHLLVPEREPAPTLYRASIMLADALAARDPEWPGRYVEWEVILLETLGFGLDLDRCAASGTREDLVYVSPRTGRAVSRRMGGIFADRLLPLPGFLVGQGPVNMGAVREGARMTGYFLQSWALPAHEQERMPIARARLVELFEHYRPPQGDVPTAYNADEADWHREIGTETHLRVPTNRGSVV